MRHRSVTRILLATTGTVFCWTVSALAASVVVAPGPGTPVQDAIDAANPGDTIKLVAGTYPECVTITKRLKLQGVNNASSNGTILEASCGAGPAIGIEADGVEVRRLFLRNHADVGIGIVGRTKVKLGTLSIASPPGGNTAPVVNVEQSTRVAMKNLFVTHFDGPLRVGPAGVRIADVPSDGRIKVQSSSVGGFVVGFLLENVGDGSVSLSGSAANANDRGIVLTNTTGASVRRNILQSNVIAGITVDAASTGNSIAGNRIESTTGVDVSDAGTGNCWQKNVFVTGVVPPCP